MRTRPPLLLLLLTSVLLAPACSKDEKKSESTTEKTDDEAKPKKGEEEGKKGDKNKKKNVDDKPAKDGDEPDKPADKKGGDADDDTAVPGARSKAPTKAELDAAPDVEIDGAKSLGCEVRMVREWLQVACRGSGAKAPTYVEVTKGKTKDTLVATIPGSSMSVKTPYEPGAEPLEATFSWADKAQTLKLEKWALKKKRPETIGKLSDAGGKGLSTAQAAGKHYCACKDQTGAAKCTGDEEGSGSEDCFRTYWADCHKMIACQNMEPGVVPTCLPGFVNAGVTGAICAQDCSKGQKCPKGSSCEDQPTGKKACTGG